MQVCHLTSSQGSALEGVHIPPNAYSGDVPTSAYTVPSRPHQRQLCPEKERRRTERLKAQHQ